MPGGGWAGGLSATTPSGPTRLWATPRRRKCTSRRTPTEPSPPLGRRCNPPAEIAAAHTDHRPRRAASAAARPNRLEVRPPAAVRSRTLQKTGREDGQWPARLVLSSRTFFEAQTETTQTKTETSRPRKSILISALRGPNIGVHLWGFTHSVVHLACEK